MPIGSVNQPKNRVRMMLRAIYRQAAQREGEYPQAKEEKYAQDFRPRFPWKDPCHHRITMASGALAGAGGNPRDMTTLLRVKHVKDSDFEHLKEDNKHNVIIVLFL